MNGLTEYDHPVADQSRIDWAHKYAAQVRERNKPPCQCDNCKRLELEPAVLQLVNNWVTR